MDLDPFERARRAETARRLRERFEEARHLSVGAEEELFVVAPDGAVAARAADVLGVLAGDPRFHSELPAAQLEHATDVADRSEDIERQLLSARRDALEAARTTGLRLLASGTHPTATLPMECAPGGRNDEVRRMHPWAAERALTAGLHVHVGVRGADRVLAVHDAIRSYLPLLAAVAANAPFAQGVDSGCASVRPHLHDGLPRQGIPPVLRSWERYVDLLAWGAKGAVFPDASRLWWEVRIHPQLPTLEVRVCDQPALAADSAVLVAVIRALVGWLCARHDAGEDLGAADDERLRELRAIAARDGIDGALPALDDGRRVPVDSAFTELLVDIAPMAATLGDAELLSRAPRRLLRRDGAMRQRSIAATAGGTPGLARALASALEFEVLWPGTTGGSRLRPGTDSTVGRSWP